MADENGVLRAVVMRIPGMVVVLDVAGHPPELEPFADARQGGDWDEVQIIYEDGPPQPPMEQGVWEMSWPWHRLDSGERKEYGDELCCLYEGKPQWQKMRFVPALSVLSSAPDNQKASER